MSHLNNFQCLSSLNLWIMTPQQLSVCFCLFPHKSYWQSIRHLSSHVQVVFQHSNTRAMNEHWSLWIHLKINSTIRLPRARRGNVLQIVEWFPNQSVLHAGGWIALLSIWFGLHSELVTVHFRYYVNTTLHSACSSCHKVVIFRGGLPGIKLALLVEALRKACLLIICQNNLSLELTALESHYFPFTKPLSSEHLPLH